MVKRLLPFVIFFLPFVAFGYTVLAPLPGYVPTTNPTLEQYLVGIFRLTIGLAGILAVIMITWCGFKMMTAKSVSDRQEAKACVKKTLFGLLLAIFSFAIINTLTTTGGNQFTGTSFNPINITTPSGLPAAPAGSPICIIQSPKDILVEGETTTLTVTCAPAATSIVWTVSGSGPVVSGTGGSPVFPTAGTYVYTAIGTNGAGAGNTATLTITVNTAVPPLCPSQQPEPVVGPVSCGSYTNSVEDWRIFGAGRRAADVTTSHHESKTFLFTTNGAGAYGSFSTNGIIDPDTGNAVYTNVDRFINISPVQCDFRYNNLDANRCASSGSDPRVRFQVGNGTPPGGSGCVLSPNTVYAINVRNEEAGGQTPVRGFDTCPTGSTCGYRATFEQTIAHQFPVGQTRCTPPSTSTATPPMITISNPTNGQTFYTDVVSMTFTAVDAVDISRIIATSYNSQDGTPIDVRTICDPISTVPCTATVASTTDIKIGTAQGDYRIEIVACNSGRLCTKEIVTVNVASLCIPVPGKSCYVLPQNPATATSTAVPNGRICTPSHGTVATIRGSTAGTNADINAYRFSLAHPWSTATVYVGQDAITTYPSLNSLNCSTNNPAGIVTDGCPIELGTTVRRVSYFRDPKICTPGAFITGPGLTYLCSHAPKPTLLISVSNIPWELSATTNNAGLGKPLGYCGNSNVLSTCGANPSTPGCEVCYTNPRNPICLSGRGPEGNQMALHLKASGAPGPGECVVRPGLDYYVNVSSVAGLFNYDTYDTFGIMMDYQDNGGAYLSGVENYCP